MRFFQVLVSNLQELENVAFFLFGSCFFVPSIATAQVGVPICFEEVLLSCDQAGEGYQGRCAATACGPPDSLGNRECPKPKGLTVTDTDNRQFYDIRTLPPGTPGRTNISGPLVDPIECGVIYDCNGNHIFPPCYDTVPTPAPTPFKPEQWSTFGPINC
jgi:hypothetical protein